MAYAEHLAVGGRVVKNPLTWIPNTLDDRGLRGHGVGIVEAAGHIPSYPTEQLWLWITVRWSGGWTFEENSRELLPAPPQ